MLIKLMNFPVADAMGGGIFDKYLKRYIIKEFVFFFFFSKLFLLKSFRRAIMLVDYA